MTKLVHIVFRVEPPIAADRSIAGKKFKIHLATGPAEVTLPLAHADQGQPGDATRSGWPHFPGARPPLPLQNVGGWVQSNAFIVPSDQQLNIQALSCRTRLPDEEVDDPMFDDRLGRAIAEWLETVRDWIGAWTRAPQVTLLRQNRPPLVSMYADSKGVMTRHISGGTVDTLVPGLPLATPGQIAACIKAASVAARLATAGSAQLTVPLQYRMLAARVRMPI
jgi:hypothetical protein